MTDGETELAETRSAQPLSVQEHEDALTQLHPNHKKAMRVQGAFFALPFLVAAAVLEFILPTPPGLVFGVIFIIAAILVLRIPHRRFAARGFAMSDDRLRVVRGLLFRSDTVVPFGRVQHIDVDRGPLERFYDLATLTLHTAGSHNASVHLPGLKHDDALAMREEIRAHIKRDSA